MEKFIKDPLYGNIRIDPNLIDIPYFQRLRHIMQNGMAYMVFPSMRHSRFEHSLGVYHIASKMIDKIRTEDLTIKLESDLKDKIKKLALYHDLGHLPFSHTFEFAFEVLQYINPNIYNQILNFTGFQVKLFKLHEMIGIRLLEEMGDKELSKLMREVYERSEPKDDDKFKKIVKLIINSDLDADRLDYLQRDSYYSGAKFGIIDPERIIITMNITPEGYIFPPKAIDDLEHFFLARFHMYSSVYNHPVIEIYNRVMAYFIAFALDSSLLKFPDNLEEFKTFTDESVFLALVKAKNDPNLSHFYYSLVERRKYKRALIEGVQAHDLLKLISEHKNEFYKTVLDYKGKVVIGEVELNTSIDKIKIERKMGNRRYYKDLREEEAVTIPPGRHRIYIGAYNDDTSNKITEYFKKEYNIIIQFRN
ncbi:MAG: HD domain-containing protein [Sulfolobaceae archaeon]